MRRLFLAMSFLPVVLQSGNCVGVDFQDDVFPIFREHCVDCHGADSQESNLRLDTMVGSLAGGDSGEPAVVPGGSDRSHLIQRVTGEDQDRRMPPDDEPLTTAEINVLRAWIDDENSWQSARQELDRRTSDHWSLRPVVQPDVPSTTFDDSPQLTAAIDAFIGRKLEAQRLRFSPSADRRRLIRRLYLVMHGLPPTPDQVNAFVADDRPEAWQILVEEALASPRYGERLATHWLDLVRFGETHGFETNRERPNAWHYRDWVIKAFNSDKPYDDFVLQQLAGDVVNEDIGTGFLVAGPYDLVKGQDPKLGLMQRQDELADMINTTGTAFLGLTTGCARCHNHKFDPISQTDYYAMQAVFAGVNHAERKLISEEVAERLAEIEWRETALRKSLEPLVRRVPSGKQPPVNAVENVERLDRVVARFVRMTIHATNNQSQPCIDEFEVFAGDRNVALASAGAKASSSGDFTHPLHKLEHINDGQYGNAKSWISKFQQGGWVQVELPKEEVLTRIVWARDRHGEYADRLAIDYVIEISTDAKHWSTVASSSDRQPFIAGQTSEPVYEFDSLPDDQADAGRRQLALLRELSGQRAELEQETMVYAGTFSQPGPTHRLYRGEPGAKREEVSPDAIAAIGRLGLGRDSPERERRLALAKWIISPTNPLTARVIVNRLWQFHFGTGIVDTPSDFGGNGTLPTHPELLDWLAAELVTSGWSIKHIQRLILTSRTWQQDSRPRAEAMKVDAATRLLWRFPPRRLAAEGIRDCILAATGKIDLKMGGPGFSAFKVDRENVRHYHPKQDYGPEDWRRMIYMTKVRQERDAVFGLFDCPDGSQVTPRRSRSTTPLQALNLLNSRFVNQQAGFLVERLESGSESTEQQVRDAYELCFGRQPQKVEVDAAVQFIDQQGLIQFARAMLNANEMVFIP